MNGNADAGDQLGAALAIGDFDGDGLGDLRSVCPAKPWAGRTTPARSMRYTGGRVAWGRPVTTCGRRPRRAARASPARTTASGPRWRAGDFSQNGRDELAIGIPGGVIGGDSGAGAVSVLCGRPPGSAPSTICGRATRAGSQGGAEPGDRFGAAVAIGDFDDDGAGDLAVGAPTDTVGNAAGAGAVHVIHGSSRGLREDSGQL